MGPVIKKRINFLKLCGHNGKIFVVIEKRKMADEMTPREKKERTLPGVERFHIDEKSGGGIYAVKNALGKALLERTGGGILWPAHWLDVRRDLVSKNFAVIPEKKFNAVCREKGLNNDEARVLSTWLKELNDFIVMPAGAAGRAPSGDDTFGGGEGIRLIGKSYAAETVEKILLKAAAEMGVLNAKHLERVADHTNASILIPFLMDYFGLGFLWGDSLYVPGLSADYPHGSESLSGRTMGLSRPKVHSAVLPALFVRLSEIILKDENHRPVLDKEYARFKHDGKTYEIRKKRGGFEIISSEDIDVSFLAEVDRAFSILFPGSPQKLKECPGRVKINSITPDAINPEAEAASSHTGINKRRTENDTENKPISRDEYDRKLAAFLEEDPMVKMLRTAVVFLIVLFFITLICLWFF